MMLGPRPRVGSSGFQRWLRRTDWPLVGAIVMLLMMGCVNLYSIDSGAFMGHFQRVLLGLGCFAAMSMLDYRALYRPVWIFVAMVVLCLIAVRVFGLSVNGSQRWLLVGGIRLQPSEFAKLAVILAVARGMQDPYIDVKRRLISVAAIALPILFVLKQPDLGTAALATMIAGSIFLVLCARPLLYIVPAVLVGATVFLFRGSVFDRLLGSLEEYQRARLTAFLHPTADPSGAGWQTQQSISSIGSGQLTGKGFLNATQSRHDFLPEPRTDFPFSVWAEEWGFVGSLVMLGVFAFLLLWIYQVAMRAKDTFGQAVCIGVGAMVFWHLVVNVLMVLGYAPVVGVTLPLVSYGGSSMVTMLLGLGIVASVSQRADLGK